MSKQKMIQAAGYILVIALLLGLIAFISHLESYKPKYIEPAKGNVLTTKI